MATTTVTGIIQASPPAVRHTTVPPTHVPDATFSTPVTGTLQPLGGGSTVFVPTIVFECPDPDTDTTGDHLYQFVVDPDIDPAGGTAGVITGYLAPSNVLGAVRGIFFRNTTASPRVVSLWMSGVPVVSEETIAAGDELVLNSMWVLWPGNSVQYQADDDGVALYISGVKEVVA